MDNYGTPQVAIVRAHGCTVEDEQGRVMLDLLAGIAVNSLGYGHPKSSKLCRSRLLILRTRRTCSSLSLLWLSLKGYGSVS